MAIRDIAPTDSSMVSRTAWCSPFAATDTGPSVSDAPMPRRCDVMSRKLKEPVFDDDNPEWTKADFARATKFPHGLKLKDLKPGELERLLRKRGPQKAPTKVPVSIRLIPEVGKNFKAKGPGLESRIA